MTWSLFEGEKFLEPLEFSNQKNQKDIVEEILSLIESGKKIIFIHGVCGSGKSGIALNLARKLGKTAIVVPIKNLQKQYKDDYEGKKYLLKKSNEKLKINVITGRKNHLCPFLEQNKQMINSPKGINLNDFEKQTNQIEQNSCDNDLLPCKIEIKEKNWNKLKEYLEQNKDIDPTDFNEIKDIKRASIAAICPYWSPVLPEEFEFKQTSLKNSKKKSFTGINQRKYIFHQRENGCTYYEQFNHFINSDVLVFNSAKYKIESILGRKPQTELDIIDECDEFLDTFSNRKTINLERMQNSIIRAIGTHENFTKIQQELMELIKHFQINPYIINAINTGEIVKLKQTNIYDILKILDKNPEFFDDLDEESYLFDVLETAKMFSGYYEDTYITLEKNKENLFINLVTTNLAKMFEKILGKNKVLILMSGTLHSENILKNIFGLKNFEKVEAEIKNQGKIIIKKTGLEKDCKYSNFSCGNISRKEYLESLNECLKQAKKPCLVHINAFNDLPSLEEKEKFNLKELITKEELILEQKENAEEKIQEFKEGKKRILFSTKAARGIDFPGEECNSIIFTKYPNPNVQDAFWKILQKTHSSMYWDFYKDKAKRELLQKVYRGIRSKKDKVEVLSPDLRVIESFEEINKEEE